MIKTNIVDMDSHYAVDINLEGSKEKIISEYIIIIYDLLTKNILDKKSIEMFNKMVFLAIKETDNNFDEFVKGVLSVYREAQEKR